MNIQPNSPSPLRARMIVDMKARGLGPTTQKAHQRACERFATWLGRSPDTTTPDDVRHFQQHLAGLGITVGRRNQIMAALKFLFRVTLRRHDLVVEIFYLKEPHRVPAVLSRDEIKRLLTMAPDLRSRTMLSLAYGCGLRASEVVKLRVCDIDSAQGIIRILQSKGGKDRNVMLPAEVLELLRDWWKERPTRKDDGVPPAERWLFPSRKGRSYLATRQLTRILHDVAAAAGVTKRISLHTMRHSFATHLLERGEDIRVIQVLLGHSTLTSTARYTQVATGLIAGTDSPLDDLNRARRKKRKAGSS